MRSVMDVLTDLGVDLKGYRLIAANAVSADGLTLTGWGLNPDGDYEAWIGVIPAPSTLALWALALGVALVRRPRERAHTCKAHRPG